MSNSSEKTTLSTKQTVGSAPRRGRRWLAMTVVMVVTFVTGAMTAAAFGGGPFGGGHWMGHGGLMSENPDPAMIEMRVTRLMKHVAIEIDLSAEQQGQLVAIVTGAAKDLLPMRKSFRTVRKKGLALLTAEQIDRTAIETLRAEQLTRAARASKRVAQALGDAAEILTPKQRQAIAGRIERFKKFRKR